MNFVKGHFESSQAYNRIFRDDIKDQPPIGWINIFDYYRSTSYWEV